MKKTIAEIRAKRDPQRGSVEGFMLGVMLFVATIPVVGLIWAAAT